MYTVFPLSDYLFIGNGHFRLKHRKNAKKSLKFIENRCTYCAMRLVLIGKHAHHKGNIRYIRYWSKAIASNFSFYFYIENSKNRTE